MTTIEITPPSHEHAWWHPLRTAATLGTAYGAIAAVLVVTLV
jgi:hypothetical protein